MATEISPVFELILLEWIETDVIIGAAIGIGAAAIIAIGNAIVSKKRRKQQQKVDSVRMVWEIREYWSETKYPESARFINDLYAIRAKADDQQTRKFLSHLEHLAILWKEETVLEDHVKEFFWPDLKMIQKNTPVKDRIYSHDQKFMRTQMSFC